MFKILVGNLNKAIFHEKLANSSRTHDQRADIAAFIREEKVSRREYRTCGVNRLKAWKYLCLRDSV